MTLLSGWQRVGIVISALWLLGVGGIATYEMIKAAPFGSFIFVEFVLDDSRPVTTGKKADGTTYTIRPVLSSLDYSRLAKVGLIPVFVGWLVVYVIVWTTKWIAKGFRHR